MIPSLNQSRTWWTPFEAPALKRRDDSQRVHQLALIVGLERCDAKLAYLVDTTLSHPLTLLSQSLVLSRRKASLFGRQ